MCLNRVETANAIVIVQPFSPCLFQQEDLPGPNLFLQFWRNQLTSSQCYVQWHQENKKKKSKAVVWPEKMPLFCRGCSDAVNKDIRNPVQDFPRTNKNKLFETLIAEGMERFCLGCRRSGRLKTVNENIGDHCSEESEAGNNETENQRYIPCQECNGHLNGTSFDPEKMKLWKKDRHLRRDAVCLACEAKKGIKEDIILCISCEKKKGSSAFDPERLNTWKMNHDVSTRAQCIDCEGREKKIKCIICLKPKSRDQYDDIMLQRWDKNHEVKRKATCKNCAADLGKKTRQPKRTWEKATYLCLQNANLVMHTRTIQCSESFPEILSKQSRFWKGLILSF